MGKKNDYQSLFDSCPSSFFTAFLAGNVAPALQAATADLQKSQLEDKLEGRLERRPEREELERRGIVSENSIMSEGEQTVCLLYPL